MKKKSVRVSILLPRPIWAGGERIIVRDVRNKNEKEEKRKMINGNTIPIWIIPYLRDIPRKKRGMNGDGKIKN